MKTNWEKGTKVGQVSRVLNLDNSLDQIPSYSRDSIAVLLIEAIGRFCSKKKFRWHILFKVDTCFDFSNHNKIREELQLQEKLELSISSFLETHETCSVVKVVNYLNEGSYHYHWYLKSTELNFLEIKRWLESKTERSQRKISFEISEDPEWLNVIRYLLQDKDSLFGLTNYMN